MVINNIIKEINNISIDKKRIEDKVNSGGNTLDEQASLLEQYRNLYDREIILKKQFSSARQIEYITL